MTRYRRLAPILALTCLLGVGTAACDGSSTADSAPPCPLPTGLIETAAAVSPDLKLGEQGFTQLDGKTVLMGAILKNTGSTVAYRTLVTFQVLDAAGQSVAASSTTELSQEIPVLLPGQSIGVGSFSYVNGKVASFQLNVGGSRSVPKSDRFSQVTGELKSIDRKGLSGGDAIVRYAMTSSYCQALQPRGVAAIFRDSAGKVVGGLIDFAQPTDAPACSTGTHEEWISAPQTGIPATADEAKTEIYPYCDFSVRSPAMETFN